MGSATCLGSNRGSVSLQTIGLAQIGGLFHSKPLVRHKSGIGFTPNHWFGPNRGSVSLQTIGLTQIGGRFRSKPLVGLKSGVGFAPNHWFDPNRGAVSLQTIGLAQIGGRSGFKPLVGLKSEAGFTPNHEVSGQQPVFSRAGRRRGRGRISMSYKTRFPSSSICQNGL